MDNEIRDLMERACKIAILITWICLCSLFVVLMGVFSGLAVIALLGLAGVISVNFEILFECCGGIAIFLMVIYAAFTGLLTDMKGPKDKENVG